MNTWVVQYVYGGTCHVYTLDTAEGAEPFPSAASVQQAVDEALIAGGIQPAALFVTGPYPRVEMVYAMRGPTKATSADVQAGRAEEVARALLQLRGLE